MKRLNSRSALMIINTTPFPKRAQAGISLTLGICHTNSKEFYSFALWRLRSFEWLTSWSLKLLLQVNLRDILFILAAYSFFLRWNRCQIVVHFLYILLPFLCVVLLISHCICFLCRRGSPFVFVCFGSLTLRGFEFLWKYPTRIP